MGTYYIKPTGMEQKDLVALLKDIETAFGGTNSGGSITIQTAVDLTASYDMNSTVSANMSSGLTFASAISARVASGVEEVRIPSLVMSTSASAVKGEFTTPGSAANSILSAGGNIASAMSAYIAVGGTGGFASFMSRICSKLTSASL
jgi:hypothetical protein